jgi:hypothetical protein
MHNTNGRLYLDQTDCGLQAASFAWTAWRTHNMALFQAGLTQELQPLSLSITLGAWRQVAAAKPRLQQALKRQTVI